MKDPVLFSDTLRVNLDPLGQFTDTEIWKALECAHLKDFAMNQTKQLMSELGEGGNNLRYSLFSQKREEITLIQM